MKVRISDIPQTGRKISFDLSVDKLNDRIQVMQSKESFSPLVTFEKKLPVSLTLNLNGSTLIIQGKADGKYRSVCSRCADDISRDLSVPIQMVLEPAAGKSKDVLSEEDVDFGFYVGDELDCDDLVSEQLIIALPYIEVCREDCKGLCSQCGANKNTIACSCKPEEKPTDERFAILRQLKLH